MLKVVDYAQRENEQGKTFFALILQGGIEMVKSEQTGRFYLTAKKTSIPSTFDEVTCQSMIGEELPGKIAKVECEHYEYTIEETGEVVTLSYTYQFIPNERDEAVFVGDEFVQYANKPGSVEGLVFFLKNKQCMKKATLVYSSVKKDN